MRSYSSRCRASCSRSPSWTSLTGHPPTTILTDEHDVRRSDGARYAERLQRAGGDVTYLEMAGHLHGSSMLTRSVPEARSWRATVHEQLRGLSSRR